jgi:alkylation response protein AidB-like acyl-CoA dehydrogenase
MKRYGEFLTAQEDLMFVEAVRKYIDKEVMPVRSALDEDYSVFEKVNRGLVELGIQRRGFAERYGGLGIRSAVTVCAITEEISRGDAGLSLHSLLTPWSLAAAMGARNEFLMDKFIPMFATDTPRVAWPSRNLLEVATLRMSLNGQGLFARELAATVMNG